MVQDKETTHDFSTELWPLLVFGGFEISKKSKTHFIVNVTFVLLILALYLFLGAMTVVTIGVLDIESDLKIQAVHIFIFIIFGVYLPASRHACAKSLRDAVYLIRRGIYNYDERAPDQREFDIKRKRVRQIRSITSLCAKMCYATAFSNIFIAILGALLSGQENGDDYPLNIYLPLPIYYPFDTRNVLGYAVSITFDCLFIAVLYTTYICDLQLFSSCILQFVAHMEVLKLSLSNIEERARAKLSNAHDRYGTSSKKELYDTKEFHKHLYDCLRENIMHHQEILRFSAAIRPYFESMLALAVSFFSIDMAVSIVVFISNPGSKLALIISCAPEIIYFFLICYSGQLVSDKSEEILDALYSTPWPLCDERFKVLLRIFIINVKKPIVLRSRGVNVPASLETFADMTATGYKIINVLRTTI